MVSRRHKVSSAIALFLVFATSQLYVQASLLTKTAATTATTASAPLVGKLATRKDRPVTLNGNTADAGASVVSGSQLQTPEGVGATVQLGALGKLDIAPKTSLTLTFDASSVNVTLSSGYAVLTTNKGINGSITTADGTKSTDSSSRSSVAAVTTGAPAGDAGADEGLLGGISRSSARTFGLIVLGGAITAAIFIPCKRGRNPSPAVAGNDDCHHGPF